MVYAVRSLQLCARILSVLALSSRFDGLDERLAQIYPGPPFSTRSVESF